MGMKRGRENGSDGGEVEYEKLRNDRLRENQKRMEELGLLDLSKSLSASVRKGGRQSSRTSSAIPRVVVPAGPARRSSRLSGGPVVSYAENVKRGSGGKEKTASRRASEAGTGGFQPEIYTEEDEKLLGDAKAEWELFVDGYDSKGVRIYDPVRGKTCHQCRQKTVGLRTSCSNCQSLRGQFCGDCLYMRYGENVLEANQNENWECPVCRNICNCSFCRLRRGWTPTGSLYRKTKSLGYKSVAHYLIFTRRGGDEDDSEVEVVPEGVATNAKIARKMKESSKEEGAPDPQMHVEDPLSAMKQEIATVEIDEEKASVKLKVEVANLAPKLEYTVETEVPTSLVESNLAAVKLEKPVSAEKMPNVQASLLSAGFRSRRAVSTGSKEGEQKENKLTVQATNLAEQEAADVEVEKEGPERRRGRPRKKCSSGKASFYGSVPKTRIETTHNPEQILLLDSDSDDSGDFDYTATATIAQRLLRRRVT